jgi:hypothetical protein
MKAVNPTVKQKFYRFHPKTGADANDFDFADMPDKARIEIAAMVRAGARFYWEKSTPDDHGPGVVKGYNRVEQGNVKFALDVAGIPYEFIDTAPS